MNILIEKEVQKEDEESSRQNNAIFLANYSNSIARMIFWLMQCIFWMASPK